MSTDFKITNGVMLNAYPDSIGNNLSDMIEVLQMPHFKEVFSLFYLLPTFFNSDLDRGFSIIDYNINQTLVSKQDLDQLNELQIKLKFDIVLNHLSVGSPQFKDLLEKGQQSKYKDFFINWNTFWEGNGTMGEDGIIIPKQEFLNKLFMRKSGLPILKVPFPDGSEQPYWNTFYQEITYNTLTADDFKRIKSLTQSQAQAICEKVNTAIESNKDVSEIDFGKHNSVRSEILRIINKKRSFLGQMDVNANAQLVWDFYEETIKKLSDYGCKILRLDAFAYLHKEVGKSNFFNTPGTFQYLKRINKIATKYNLTLLPEIHAEYGLHLHDKIANEGYYIYDFFLPGLIIHALEKGINKPLLHWINEILNKGFKTINMLGCHDGIPVLDLKGKEVNGKYNKGLLEDHEIEDIMQTIIRRGGKVKNLYDASGKKLSYYQVNATFFSALGENPQKMLLARAIQMFTPGIPQVWYLDIFAGKNDYKAVEKASSAGHKEINRTNLSLKDVQRDLKNELVINQLKILKIRNSSKAFNGAMNIKKSQEHILDFEWRLGNEKAQLQANLETCRFEINYSENGDVNTLNF
jgi:sucrose phosphorylase